MFVFASTAAVRTAVHPCASLKGLIPSVVVIASLVTMEVKLQVVTTGSACP